MRIEDLPHDIDHTTVKIKIPKGAIIDGEDFGFQEGYIIPFPDFVFLTPDGPEKEDRRLFVADLGKLEPIEKLILIDYLTEDEQ